MDKNIENIKMNLQEIESKLQGCINFTLQKCKKYPILILS